MRVLLENVNENRDLWLGLRMNTIGSSEIATIIGMNEYETEWELWARKKRLLPEREVTDPMIIGTLMEPMIGALWSRRYQIPVKRANIFGVHDDHGFASASPDFFMSLPDTPILETKYTTWRNRGIWENGIPDPYAVQLTWQMGVFGARRGFVTGLVGDDVNNLQGAWLKFNAELFEFLLEGAYRFLNYLRKDIPPPATRQDYKLIAEVQGPRIEEEIDLPEDSLLLADELERVKQMRTCAEDEVARLKNMEDGFKGRLLQLMSNKAVGVLPDGRTVTVKKAGRAGYVAAPATWIEVKLKKAKEWKPKKRR